MRRASALRTYLESPGIAWALAICAGGLTSIESAVGADLTVERNPAANARIAATVIVIFLRLMLASIRNQIRA